jgi:hypothetical protein
LDLGSIAVTAPRRPATPDELDVPHRLDAPLGPLTLLGADLDRHQAAPGDPVLLTTFWRADGQPTQDLSVHLALRTPDGSPAAEYDLPPTAPWHPTATWQPGDVWRGQHILHLPAHLDSGDHTWYLTLLPISSSTRLPTPLTITAPDRTFIPPPVDIETDARLGAVITLLGATLQPGTHDLTPGAPLTITLVWRAEEQTPTSYHVFLHLVGPDGTLIAQSDGIPADWTRPTTGWLPGEYVADTRTLTIPPETPAGDYALSAGLYVPGGERLAAPDGSDAIPLTTITLEPR